MNVFSTWLTVNRQCNLKCKWCYAQQMDESNNMDLSMAKKLIDTAVTAGCNAVKFRKRTIELNYTQDYLNEVEESPWGHTRRARVETLEFGKEEYDAIDAYCKKKGDFVV